MRCNIKFNIFLIILLTVVCNLNCDLSLAVENNFQPNKFRFSSGIVIEDKTDIDNGVPARVPTSKVNRLDPAIDSNISWQEYNGWRSSFNGLVSTINIGFENPIANNTVKLFVRNVLPSIKGRAAGIGKDDGMKIGSKDGNHSYTYAGENKSAVIGMYDSKTPNNSRVHPDFQIGKARSEESIWIFHNKKIGRVELGAYKNIDYSLRPVNQEILTLKGKGVSTNVEFSTSTTLVLKNKKSCMFFDTFSKANRACEENKLYIGTGKTLEVNNLYGTLGRAGKVSKYKPDGSNVATTAQIATSSLASGEEQSGMLETDGLTGKYDIAYILYINTKSGDDLQNYPYYIIIEDEEKTCSISPDSVPTGAIPGSTQQVSFTYQNHWNENASFTLLFGEKEVALDGQDRHLKLCAYDGHTNFSPVLSWGGLMYVVPRGPSVP